MLGAEDEQHLDLALSQGRVLFTQDRDFLILAASGVPHAGIAYAGQREPIGNIVRGLVLIYQIMSAEDMIGKVEYV